MHQAIVAGNAQYIVYINSDEKKATSKAAKPPKPSGELKIERRFEVNWEFYKGQYNEKRLQIAV